MMYSPRYYTIEVLEHNLFREEMLGDFQLPCERVLIPRKTKAAQEQEQAILLLWKHPLFRPARTNGDSTLLLYHLSRLRGQAVHVLREV
jgi:hypothetical protein